jgi:hypothetical protein
MQVAALQGELEGKARQLQAAQAELKALRADAEGKVGACEAQLAGLRRDLEAERQRAGKVSWLEAGGAAKPVPPHPTSPHTATTNNTNPRMRKRYGAASVQQFAPTMLCSLVCLVSEEHSHPPSKSAAAAQAAAQAEELAGERLKLELQQQALRYERRVQELEAAALCGGGAGRCCAACGRRRGMFAGPPSTAC